MDDDDSSDRFNAETERLHLMDLERVGNKVPSLKNLIAEHRTERDTCHDSGWVATDDTITYMMNTAHRAWLIVWVMKLRGRKQPGRSDTLQDAARALNLTYNGITEIEKLYPRRDWIRTKIDSDRQTAENAGRHYKAPSWRTIHKWIVRKPDPPAPPEPTPQPDVPVSDDLAARLFAMTQEKKKAEESEFYLAEQVNHLKIRVRDLELECEELRKRIPDPPDNDDASEREMDEYDSLADRFLAANIDAPPINQDFVPTSTQIRDFIARLHEHEASTPDAPMAPSMLLLEGPKATRRAPAPEQIETWRTAIKAAKIGGSQGWNLKRLTAAIPADDDDDFNNFVDLLREMYPPVGPRSRHEGIDIFWWCETYVLCWRGGGRTKQTWSVVKEKASDPSLAPVF